MVYMHQLKEMSSEETEKKKDPIICCPQEIHFKYKGIEIKSWRKIHYSNTSKKKSGKVILTSERTYFKARNVIKDKGIV